jgi:hypothetical protein
VRYIEQRIAPVYGELGFALLEDRRGRGYAEAAVRAVRQRGTTPRVMPSDRGWRYSPSKRRDHSGEAHMGVQLDHFIVPARDKPAFGGRGVCWNEPAGHQWAMLTVSYARQSPLSPGNGK